MKLNGLVDHLMCCVKIVFVALVAACSPRGSVKAVADCKVSLRSILTCVSFIINVAVRNVAGRCPVNKPDPTAVDTREMLSITRCTRIAASEVPSVALLAATINALAVCDKDGATLDAIAIGCAAAVRDPSASMACPTAVFSSCEGVTVINSRQLASPLMTSAEIDASAVRWASSEDSDVVNMVLVAAIS
eukprot:COSAG01_NODE_26965_length_698_cov_0.864775_1_plen_190_part_00